MFIIFLGWRIGFGFLLEILRYLYVVFVVKDIFMKKEVCDVGIVFGVILF